LVLLSALHTQRSKDIIAPHSGEGVPMGHLADGDRTILALLFVVRRVGRALQGCQVVLKIHLIESLMKSSSFISIFRLLKVFIETTVLIILQENVEPVIESYLDVVQLIDEIVTRSTRKSVFVVVNDSYTELLGIAG
jgi:hypothetical protein